VGHPVAVEHPVAGPKPWRKLSLGRPKCSLEDNIKNDLKRRFAYMDWSRLLRVMDQSEWNTSFPPPSEFYLLTFDVIKIQNTRQQGSDCGRSDRNAVRLTENTAVCPTCVVTYYNSFFNIFIEERQQLVAIEYFTKTGNYIKIYSPGSLTCPSWLSQNTGKNMTKMRAVCQSICESSSLRATTERMALKSKRAE